MRRILDFGIRLGTTLALGLTIANTLWFLGNCIGAEFRVLSLRVHGFPGDTHTLRGVLFLALAPVGTGCYAAIAALILIANLRMLQRARRGELPVRKRELDRWGRTFVMVVLGLMVVVLARVVLASV